MGKRHTINPVQLVAAINRSDAAQLEMLLSRGADPNGRVNDEYHGDMPVLLFAAGRHFLSGVELLIKAGADPNVVMTGGSGAKPGRTPLHSAIQNGPVITLDVQTSRDYEDTRKVVELLLRSGANPNAIDKGDTLPLYDAAGHGYLDICKQLVEFGATARTWPEGCIPPLVGAAGIKDVAIAQWLLDIGTPLDGQTATGFTALMAAANSSSPQMVSLLLNRGANVNHRSQDGRSALLCVAIRARWLRPEPAHMKCLEIAKLLVQAGADLSPVFHSKPGVPVDGTALEIAAQAPHPHLANFLREVAAKK